MKRREVKRGEQGLKEKQMREAWEAEVASKE
jgi:hypothetical protein